jgi:uncharacterized protein (DUF2141 family)
MKARQIKQLIILCASAAIICGGSTAAFAQTGELLVKAKGFKNSEGQALFAVVDSPAAYDDIAGKAMAKSRQKIVSGKSQSTFKLPYGWYAVSVVQDQNKNNKLDTNFFGIPKEPYGFSNNPSGLGKPTYDSVKFELKSAHQEIEIKVED